jgi:hypothetical protein
MVEYLHPAFMVVVLACVFTALRYGLKIRRHRALGLRMTRTLRTRHLLFGKLALSMLAVGFLAGLATTTLWLGDEPLTTFHGLVAGLAIVCFTTLGWAGRRLEGGDASAREIHAWAAFAAVLMAGTGAVAGLVLLP